MIKIGFLGPKGTFSQEALELYTSSDPAYEEVEMSTISDLIWAVEKRQINEALIPMENSIEGAVNVSLDMLAMDVNLFIKNEVIIPIRQNLLIPKGTNIKDIRLILSHPQALGQCRKYIDSKFPHAQIRHVFSTAGGAMEIAMGLTGGAAIGSRKSAEVFGLEIAEEDIQDGDNNYTRFVVLAREDSPPTGKDKTSIVFSSEHKPGSLYRVLDIFNLWDINMTRIESRPAKSQLGRYIFFVDIAGHREDPDVASALTMVKRKTSFFKLLGSYPAFSI